MLSEFLEQVFLLAGELLGRLYEHAGDLVALAVAAEFGCEILENLRLGNARLGPACAIVSRGRSGAFCGMDLECGNSLRYQAESRSAHGGCAQSVPPVHRHVERLGCL